MVIRALPHRHRHSIAPPRICLLRHLLRVAAIHGVVCWIRPRLAGDRLIILLRCVDVIGLHGLHWFIYYILDSGC